MDAIDLFIDQSGPKHEIRMMLFSRQNNILCNSTVDCQGFLVVNINSVGIASVLIL